MTLTLGSLFDGIGAFPYAASFYGIEPIWASEILPHAVSVTRRHFPSMEHIGDITKLHGGKLPPVDILTFGSPCQGLSAAGHRLGFADHRSGLFGEAIRIIKEMQEETNGQYPKIAVWENVVGAMQTSGGLDFRAVIQAFTETEVPIPDSGKWSNAGMVRSKRADLAWCVYNAKYFGVPQRRRRIFFIADFTGRSAGEILFVPKSLRWYFAQGGTPQKRVATNAGTGAFDEGIGINGNIAGTLDANYGKGTGMRCGSERDVVLCAATGQRNAEIFENISPTLNCNCEQPIICMKKDSTKLRAYGISSLSSNSMKSANPHSGIYEAETARTLDQTGGNPACNQGGIMIVLNDQGGDSMTVEKDDISPTLRSETHGNLPIVVHPEIVGTLCASGAGLSRTSTMGSATDFCIVQTDDATLPLAFTRQNYSEYAECDTAKTLMASDDITTSDLVLSGAATAIDCRNLKESMELSATLQSKSTAGYSLNYQNPIRRGLQVRRLTPTEAERLMGFPDGWTEYGHDGVRISDTKRYQMLGNSIVTPCVAYIMQGIVDALEKR